MVSVKVGTEKYCNLLPLFMSNSTTVVMLEEDILVSLQLVNYILNLHCVSMYRCVLLVQVFFYGFGKAQ